MGIGYASLANNILSINGEISATAEQDNFKVYFTGEVPKKYTSDEAIKLEAKPVAQSQNATVNILGLNKKGDSGYAILEIENASNDIDAEITVVADIEETDMFDMNVIMCDQEGTATNEFLVASGQKTYVKIFAELLKVPTSVVKATIAAKVTAVPQDTVENQPDIPDVPIPPVPTDIFSAYYAKAEEKLATMTLDEKIAQMYVIGTSAATNYTELDKYQFGGQLYLLDSFKNTSGSALAVSKVKQQIKTSQEAAKIPLLMAIDEEGETVSRLNSTLYTELNSLGVMTHKFQNSAALYTSGGLEAIKNDTIYKSKVLTHLGFNLNFAPDVDIADSGFYIYKRT